MACGCVRVSALFIFLANTQLSIWSSGSYLVTYANKKRCYPSVGQKTKNPILTSRKMISKNGTEHNLDDDEPFPANDEDLGRRERKKRQRQLDYERRRKLWLDRYGSADALRSTFGSGPPWGDLTPQQTRAFYHILLPRSLLALSEMGLMKPDELAPLAYEARIAAKEYARSRCVWTGRVATAAFDQYRSLRDRGRLLGPGSSSSMSWEEVWEKYEAQIVEEECAEVIDDDDESSFNKKEKKKKKKRLWRNKKVDDDEESLTMRIYMRILEKSCATNKAFDSLFLRDNDEDMAHIDLAAIATQLEDDIHSILLSPKENIKREKKIGKMNKKIEKDREREEKRQRKAKRKEGEEQRKELRRQEKLVKKEHQEENVKEIKQLWEGEDMIDDNDDDDNASKKHNISTEHSKRAEALRILANTRRQFRILFPKKKNH